MGRGLSRDLRDRVIAAIEGGLSCRQAAERFFDIQLRPGTLPRFVSRKNSRNDSESEQRQPIPRWLSMPSK